MFYRWGEIAYRFRITVPILIVAAILGLFAFQGTKLGDRMSQEGWDDPHSSSSAAARIELDTFGRDNSGDVIILFEAPEGKSVDDPAVITAAQQHLTQLKEQHPDHIAHVTSYFDKQNPKLITPDKRTAFAAVGLKGDGEQTLKSYRAVEDAVLTDALPGEVTTRVAGATAVADALDDGMSGDIKRAELFALPLVALLLLIVFGSVVAAVMPLVVGILSIAGSLGVLSVLAAQAQVNVFAQSVVTLLGLGLAIDYGLFMVSRFREEMAAGKDIKPAVATTVATAGQTVVFSALMVIVALSGLFVFPQAFLKSIAYGAISAVGLAAFLSVTVLPALFGMLGKNIDKWAIRKTAKDESLWEQTIWARIPAWSMKHSRLVAAGIIAVLLGLTIPLTGVKFGGINETYLPPSDEVRAAQSTFDSSFPDFRTEPIKLVVTEADNNQLVQIYQQANAVEGLTGRFSPSHPTKDGTTVLSAGIVDRENNDAVVKQLRAIDVPEGVNVYIGGTPALEVESIEALFDKLPWMALYIIIATFVLMALVFGSLILPAKAIIMTVLGLGATLGILTAMFVDGLGGTLFDFTAGPLMSPVLVLIVAIVYGLSTDYEVFLVSRMVESRNRGDATDHAIKYGTAHTGSIITAAALIMIVVCGAFGFSNIVMMKYIAFGMIAALILDATIIRMMLVPAVMHLLREDNWWAPQWVKLASERMGHGKEPVIAPVAKPAPQPALVPSPASEPAPEPDPAPTPAPVPREMSVHDVSVHNAAIRGGRSTISDENLVPFAELMKRLREEGN
ncbi:MMPL family transporter [Corynebacterium hindlerae]|uniref:MMPL family transporter n=1 Tax=Corynebacterium hindlerae TaxID=699041 RepID=A0A7G5FCU6_9CORY|nr:MMPL family transporter [Corynebacterium hindlerae]QMV84437.1 MMPL family transporter [Corynebacterium hindlerae]